MRYKCVTLWHRKNDGGWKRMLFERAYVTEVKATKTLGSERTRDNSMRVRLYCIAKCEVEVGDKMCVGYDSAISPPDDAYNVTEVQENFETSARLRHYRVECK